MVEINGDRRSKATDETVVQVNAGDGVSGNTFHLEPGESLEILDDEPNRVEVTVVDGGQDE